MIYGIGTDIVQIARIASSITRHGSRFVEKILGQQELEKYNERKGGNESYGIRYLATRFAAKEAFSKALGTGIQLPMSWHTMQTLNDARGKPVVMISGTLKEFMEQQGLTAHISISDESEYAVAFVIVEKNA
jgi:holo-[acyl-carrier protein] synthase